MRKKYKVLFEIEGSIEISARNDEEAGDIIDRMERDKLFELCDEYGCKTTRLRGRRMGNMRVPKRLPDGLTALVEIEEVFGQPTLLSAYMRRYKGSVHIELTYVDNLCVFNQRLVTIDSVLRYDKYKPYKCKVEEEASSHRRCFDVFRKAVLAS